jgi:succinate-acetate transporter protein
MIEEPRIVHAPVADPAALGLADSGLTIFPLNAHNTSR